MEGCTYDTYQRTHNHAQLGDCTCTYRHNQSRLSETVESERGRCAPSQTNGTLELSGSELPDWRNESMRLAIRSTTAD
jgi:hypothetical protein